MKIILKISLTSALMLTGQFVHACYKYEDASVTLSGKVVLREFFGPPGYGESPKTDSKEKQAILVLDQPLCVDESEDEDAENNQKEITLVPLGGFSLSGLVGKTVTVQGSLFHAISGHHHTSVLIALKQLPVAMQDR